jgi:diguanylate cyclase (GGDEF)-like protein
MPLRRANILHKLPLPAAITIPFVLQVAIAIGVIGYLSFKNGQAAVNDLASQVRRELTARILQQLENTLETPQIINQINANSLLEGDLNLLTGQGENPLWQQMQVFPATNLIYCAQEADGAFLGVGRSQGGVGDALHIQIANEGTNRYFHYYSVDDSGHRLALETVDDKRYDPRVRPWYKAAKAKGAPTWSEVYLDFETLLPTITANVPVYERATKGLLGVCATDIILSEELNGFLQNLNISPSGIAFIVDASGALIASSTAEPITAGQGEETLLLAANESSNPVIRDTVDYLDDTFGSVNQVESSQLDFAQQGERYFVQTARFGDGLGLDWVLVLVVPEADFMARIHHHNRITLVLYLLALVVATLTGIFLATGMTEPLHRLSANARDIARGNWQQPIALDRSDAIGDLSRSLAVMAEQLKTSLNTLEQRVEERNVELTELNQELQRLVHIDGLTQVSNRRQFDTVLKQEWKRLAREQQPLTLMLCDVDYFKLYNDTYGHQAGDRCLQEVAQVFMDVTHRPADLVARYGGEEFGIILPNTDTSGAIHIAEQIHAVLGELAIDHSASKKGVVTVSIGIATLVPNLRDSPRALVAATDQALYSAKARGRNSHSIASGWEWYHQTGE